MAIYSGTNLESETARESATKNQKLKPANQKPKKKESEPNLPPPLNILLNEILWPTYPHKGSNPPPPLNTMLKRMLHLCIFPREG